MTNVDGWITIGTRLETKDFERQLKQQEQRLKQYERENERLTKSKEVAERNLEEAKFAVEYMEKQKEESIKLARSQEEINAIEEEWAKNQEIINAGYEGFKEDLDNINTKLQANNRNISLTKDEIIETQRNLDSSKVRDYFKEQGKGINNAIKKVGRWALALIGIRGVYSAISKAMSTLSSFNKELKDDLSYIRIALASALEPIINGIVNTIYTLLKYIQYLIYQWTGHNIFENANKNLEKANKNAKKLQKTMASFDEANTVAKKQEEITPTQDLSKITDISELPKWIQTLDKYKTELAIIIGTIAGLFAISKISGWLKNLGLLFTGTNGLNSILSTLGKITLVAGSIVLVITISKKIKQEMDELEQQLDRIREKSRETLGDWLEKTDDVNTLSQAITSHLTAGKEALKKGTSWLYSWNRVGEQYLKNAEYVVEENGKILEKEYEIWLQKDKNKEIGRQILDDYGKQIAYAQETAIKLESQGKNAGEVRSVIKDLKIKYDEIFNTVYNTNKQIDKINETDVQDKSFEIKPKLNTKNMVSSMNSWLDEMKLKIEEIFSKNGFLANLLKKLPGMKNTLNALGISIPYAKGGIAYNPIKMASGAVINRPNLGVPVGGESGLEGVVPLTNTQSMDLLGQAIGKNVKIIATIPVYMGNRQVAREMRTIMAEDDFAYNR